MAPRCVLPTVAALTLFWVIKNTAAHSTHSELEHDAAAQDPPPRLFHLRRRGELAHPAAAALLPLASAAAPTRAA